MQQGNNTESNATPERSDVVQPSGQPAIRPDAHCAVRKDA